MLLLTRTSTRALGARPCWRSSGGPRTHLLPRSPLHPPHHHWRQNASHACAALGHSPPQEAKGVHLIAGGFEATGVTQFLGITAAASLLAYQAHPFLLQGVASAWDFSQDGDGAFTSSFFSLVGIIFGFFAGNTFLILFDRQVNIVQELYGEVFALELLVQAQLLAVKDKGFRSAMAQCVRRYMTSEIYTPIDMQSPFESNSAYSELIRVLCEEKSAGYNVKTSVEAAEKLADSQSRRSSLAAEVLPPVHFLFLNAQILIFVLCFLVFDTATGAQLQLASANVATDSIAALANDLNPALPVINEERRLAFAALVGVLVLTQQVIMDLSTPTEGLYSFRSCLDGRVTFLLQLTEDMECQPATWVPEQLQRLAQLGMIGGFTGSDEVPSIPETQHLGGRKAAAGLPEARGSALRLFEVSGGADSTGNGGGTSSH